MASSAKETTDHDTIKKWVESRGGKPSVVVENEEKTELLRLNLPGYSEDNLEEIDWKNWLEIFDRKKLKFLYLEQTPDGKKSKFNKLVRRED